MHDRTAIAPPAPTLLKDAVARMALWANVLPGWCDQGEPAAKVLQTALGIWLVPEAIDKEDEEVLMTLRLVDDKYFDDIEDTKRRLRYRPRLVVAQDDSEASGLIIHQANRVLLLEIARKKAQGKRWRATIDDGNAFLSDWSIIKRHLVRHQSFREIARDLRLDEAGIRRRFHDALASISTAFGPIQWPESLSPHTIPYYRGARRTGRRPAWRHKLHVHQDTKAGWYPREFKSREQVLTAELDLTARFIANGGAVQKLPPGLAVDFDTVDVKGHPIGHVSGVDIDGNTTARKQCAAYGADGELLWVVSSRPQSAWDNVPGGPRYPDADLFAGARWEGKQHSSFAKALRRGLLWLQPWQSKERQPFAVQFYNCDEDRLLPGKRNGGGRARAYDETIGKCLAAFQQPFGGRRDCRGPAWEWWTIGSKDSSSGVESSDDVKNDARELMAKWVPPASYFNDGMNDPFFE